MMLWTDQGYKFTFLRKDFLLIDMAITSTHENQEYQCYFAFS